MHSSLDARGYRMIESSFWSQSRSYGFRSIKLSAIYPSDWFADAGEAADICSKEMIAVSRQVDGKPVGVLAPEYTAPLSRLIAAAGGPGHCGEDRFAYFERAYRYNRPQARRFREFTQCGWECYGGAFSEAEVIFGAYEFLQRLGWGDVELKINTIGRVDEQQEYARIIQAHFGSFEDPELQVKLLRSPLRVLDVIEDVEGLPEWPLSTATRDEFAVLCQELDEMGVPYTVDRGLVRGLDYYEKTVFEFRIPGTSCALLAGGRYDRITAGWQAPVRACGWAAGVERLLQFPRLQGIEPGPVLLIVLDRTHAHRVALQLRAAGVPVKICILTSYSRIVSTLDKSARSGVGWALILGEDEIRSGTVSYKQLNTSNTRSGITLNDFITHYHQVSLETSSGEL